MTKNNGEIYNVSDLISLQFKINLIKLRSSQRKCSVKKGVPGKLAKFTGKHLCQSIFFNKVTGNFIEKRFPVNNRKFQRAPLRLILNTAAFTKVQTKFNSIYNDKLLEDF